MHEIETRQLHFAAYMKASGCEFVSCIDRVFKFKSEKTLDELRVEHANSFARKVDMELIELRRFIKV